MSQPRQLMLPIVLVILTTLAMWFVYGVIEERLHLTKEQMPASEVQIGGAFSLTNQRGETITDQSFPTKFKLVYFGFAHCPDVCPTDLGIMTQTMQALGKDADKVQPIFITVDPERDTVEALKEYATNFYPGFQMLTGSKEAVSQAINGYKVYASQVEGHEVGKYLMNHSAFTYLMDKEGHYVTHFAHETEPEAMAKTITSHIQSAQ